MYSLEFAAHVSRLCMEEILSRGRVGMIILGNCLTQTCNRSNRAQNIA